MNPEQPYGPTPPPAPGPQQPNQPIYNPAQQPYGMQPPLSAQPASSPKSKLPFIVIGAVVGLLVVIVLIVVLSSGGKKKPAATTDTSQNAPQGPQPAKAIDAEQASNSISQDISSFDDDKNFPSTELDDKALGL